MRAEYHGHGELRQTRALAMVEPALRSGRITSTWRGPAEGPSARITERGRVAKPSHTRARVSKRQSAIMGTEERTRRGRSPHGRRVGPGVDQVVQVVRRSDTAPSRICSIA